MDIEDKTTPCQSWLYFTEALPYLDRCGWMLGGA